MKKAAAKNSARKDAGPSYAPAKPQDVLMRQETDGEIYVMPARRTQQHFFVIDGLAANLWCAFDGTTTVKEHIDRLVEENADVPPSKIKKDVTKFVASLKKLGLVD